MASIEIVDKLHFEGGVNHCDAYNFPELEVWKGMKLYILSS